MRSNEKFSQRAETAIEKARLSARDLGHSSVGTEHLLLGILTESEGLGARILLRRGLQPERLRQAVREMDGTGFPGGPVLGLTENARKAVETAAAEAEHLRQGFIGTEHLLLGILRQPDCGGARILRGQGADLNDIYTDIAAIFGHPVSGDRQQLGTARSVRRADTRVLDQYSRDLTALAAAGELDPVVSRGDEIRRVTSQGTLDLLRGHILFFTERSGADREHYEYDGLVEESFTFDTDGRSPIADGVLAGCYEVTLYWEWPETYIDISRRTSDNGNTRKYPAELGDYVSRNPQYFFAINQASEDEKERSEGYDDGDQKIGNQVHFVSASLTVN